MDTSFKNHIENQLQEIESKGLFKTERVITTPQKNRIAVQEQGSFLNLCSNNYLGLANHPDIIRAAHQALDRWGFGMASVRFICGTQEIHKELEGKISQFLGTEDTILYSSCFDANTGLFETLLGEEDAIVSDELNHASIIDGIRLCKAKRFRYKNSDMKNLEEKLVEAQNSRFRMIATDGVFSMDGTLAKLKQICDLADRYKALVMVDDSHAVGIMGDTGRGMHEHHGVQNRVDLLTGTLGKALGGASGGYTSGSKEMIDILRQKSRPYLFSNSLAPVVVASSIAAIDLLSKSRSLKEKLDKNCKFFRIKMMEAGFNIAEGEHPILPIMLGEAVNAVNMAKTLLHKGIYVTPFSYPVVPVGKARIRVQVSAVHQKEDLQIAVDSFREVKKELDL